jgi:uncharacterized protein
MAILPVFFNWPIHFMPLYPEPGHFSYLKRIAIITLGWIFILAGIAGLFLPLLQGILFLIIGLVILSNEYRWAERLLARVRSRFPRTGALLTRARSRATAILGNRRSRKLPQGE